MVLLDPMAHEALKTKKIKVVYERGITRPVEPLELPEGTSTGRNCDETARTNRNATDILAEIAALPLEGASDSFSGQEHDRFSTRKSPSHDSSLTLGAWFASLTWTQISRMPPSALHTRTLNYNASDSCKSEITVTFHICYHCLRFLNFLCGYFCPHIGHMKMEHVRY